MAQTNPICVAFAIDNMVMYMSSDFVKLYTDDTNGFIFCTVVLKKVRSMMFATNTLHGALLFCFGMTVFHLVCFPIPPIVTVNSEKAIRGGCGNEAI